MLVFLSCADRIVVRRPFLGRPFWAVIDVLVHGAVALAVTGPCIRRATRGKRALALSGLAFLSATVLDLDHFVAAGSLDLHAALSLAARPPTHSLTFALLLGTATSLLSRDRAAGWVVFAALASHPVGYLGRAAPTRVGSRRYVRPGLAGRRRRCYPLLMAWWSSGVGSLRSR